MAAKIHVTRSSRDMKRLANVWLKGNPSGEFHDVPPENDTTLKHHGKIVLGLRYLFSCFRSRWPVYYTRAIKMNHLPASLS